MACSPVPKVGGAAAPSAPPVATPMPLVSDLLTNTACTKPSIRTNLGVFSFALVDLLPAWSAFPDCLHNTNDTGLL